MKKYILKSDRKLNPALKKQVTDLRGGILGQCNKVYLPPRFVLKMSKDRLAGTITDKQTGRTTSLIGLYALAEVKGTLSELFG